MIDKRILKVIICRKMHWTFQEYQDAPAWFVDLIYPTMEVEATVDRIKAENQAKLREKRTS